MTSPDGRQITVRYARAGDLLGIAAIVGGPAPVSVQILTDAALLMLNVRTLQMGGQTEPKVGWLMAQEVTRRLYDTLGALAGHAFGSLQQRVARHLLDLAASRQQGRGLVVKMTQQELADAVGSVRPAVARIIRKLRVGGASGLAPRVRERNGCDRVGARISPDRFDGWGSVIKEESRA